MREGASRGDPNVTRASPGLSPAAGYAPDPVGGISERSSALTPLHSNQSFVIRALTDLDGAKSASEHQLRSTGDMHV